MQKLVGKLKELSPTQKRMYLLILFALVIVGVAIYWMCSERYVSTDDAYLNANVVEIAPRITGQVVLLNVVNNQLVRKGQLLFALDPSSFNVAVAKARSQLVIDQANLADAQNTSNRILTLVGKKFMPAQAADDANAKLDVARATVQMDQANLIQALLNLSYTQVYAPVNGWITNMSLRAGNTVMADQSIFALVDTSEFWADANFKETQLETVKPGQAATVEVDMYPNHPFKGVVDSLSGGSGSAFSLLPPQNATGNWVKVTQRVPVRVRILDLDAKYPLRIGTTATVTVDTSKVLGNNAR